MSRLTEIWRHPIKAHGAEALETAELKAGQRLPGDRIWAVRHDGAKQMAQGDWAPCNNFNRGARSPALMAVRAKLDGDTVRLTHPEAEAITLRPDEEAGRLVAWSKALTPADRAQPLEIHRSDAGLTDTPFPSISIASHASLRALSQAAGRELSTLRFRMNLWIDGGLAPWQEFDWIDRDIRIGTATLRMVERNTRCKATHADPETGRIDIDLLELLERETGARDFGIYAEVIDPGRITLGDEVRT